MPEDPHNDLVKEVESGDTLRSLVALRDYVAHELQGNRCPTCEMSKLRTGDTAALVLRLQHIINEIAILNPKKPENMEGVLSLDDIRKRRDKIVSDPLPSVELGTRSSPRRQSGRQPRFKG